MLPNSRTINTLSDTTVQPKNVTHPTDAKLMLKATLELGALARRHGVALRQSYVRVAKRAALMAGRYIHAKQFKRARRELRFLRARLGRLTRDIARKTRDDDRLSDIFDAPLRKAHRIRWQRQQERGPKLYSWHAPETECIGKGKAHKPYEFGCKVSITTTNRRSKGGQFVLHAKAPPGNPYDGHTLREVIVRGCKLDSASLGEVLAGELIQGALDSPEAVPGQPKLAKRPRSACPCGEPNIANVRDQFEPAAPGLEGSCSLQIKQQGL